ncbi:hypothetical protein BaOVIS_021850 [Babesia ovis]|uniref:5'-3' DNA helicase ZGRF1-like N-terminal domain-containing protein n=1 Tax=Babesia ovis TaxID=5869 RepID=A0A9W5TBT5_BABOV|nr:hypothetical protein BaOVIS_021850 [Babesia ovis]
MIAHDYNCLFSRNSDKKHKTWRDGVICVHGTHRFAHLALYEVDISNIISGSPVDTFDLFNLDRDSLSGQTITSPKTIVKILDINTNVRKGFMLNLYTKVSKTLKLPANNGTRKLSLGNKHTSKPYDKYHAVESNQSLGRKIPALEDLQDVEPLPLENDAPLPIENAGNSVSITTAPTTNTEHNATASTTNTGDNQNTTSSLPLYPSSKRNETLPRMRKPKVGLNSIKRNGMRRPSLLSSDSSDQSASKQIDTPASITDGPREEVTRASQVNGNEHLSQRMHPESPKVMNRDYVSQKIYAEMPVAINMSDNSRVNTLNRQDKNPVIPSSCDDPPILEPELMGCIEAALQQFS